ncbi:hypothetical protein [Mediterranea sp. An20]|uniref:hypothetical protein n=1 Tax=Mediterranea sp. An20 TaxID=1965586 RepID=UPI001EF652BC|nr:hypothetical protein [Mediterranea sp. An20]
MNRTALDQYEELVTDALKSFSVKLRKSFKTTFIQFMILYMVLPKKINFTQMGRYSDSSEQRFRQLFEREFDWMLFNLFLMRQRYYPSLSIGLLKAYLDNIYMYMLKRILSKSGLKPNRTFNSKLIKELFGIVTEAA